MKIKKSTTEGTFTGKFFRKNKIDLKVNANKRFFTFDHNKREFRGVIFLMTIRQIKETCLYIKDLEITQQFYNEKLGFEVLGKVKNRYVFFRAGTSVLLCFIAEATKNETSLPSHYGSGNIHLAFEVTQEEYPLWKEKIKGVNIEIIQEQEWKNGLKSFYFRDPDGHLLEIVPEGIWD